MFCLGDIYLDLLPNFIKFFFITESLKSCCRLSLRYCSVNFSLFFRLFLPKIAIYDYSFNSVLTNQWTGFYITETFVMKELKSKVRKPKNKNQNHDLFVNHDLLVKIIEICNRFRVLMLHWIVLHFFVLSNFVWYFNY